MRMLYLICESNTTLEKLKSCIVENINIQAILSNNVLSINYLEENEYIEYIGIEPEDYDEALYECGEDSEIFHEFYCNEYFPNPSVFWLRYSIATPDRYLSKLVLESFRDGGVQFLVNNARDGNKTVDEFLKSLIELI
jgi:hypothetical protein